MKLAVRRGLGTDSAKRRPKGQIDYEYNTSGSVEQISQDDVENVQQAYYWNEEQWLMGVHNDNGVHHYIYDQNGERILKSSVTLDWTEVNGENINEVANLAPYTLYVNAYYVVTEFADADKASRHYYMGMQRVASELTTGTTEGFSAKTTGSQDSLTLNDTSVWQNLKSVLGHFGMEENTDYTMAELQRQPTLGDYRSAAEIPLDASASSRDYPDAEPSTMNKMDESPGSRVMYWYHPDYLGNVELITDYNGEVYEFFFYNPWGESLYEWQSGTGAFTSPYRFNAKELDPETGLHYYGARYYEPKVSVWLSVDPMAEEYPSHSPYVFVANNPVVLYDPDGNYWVSIYENCCYGTRYTLKSTSMGWINAQKHQAWPVIGNIFMMANFASQRRDPSYKTTNADIGGAMLTIIGAGSLKLLSRLGNIKGLGKLLLSSNRVAAEAIVALMSDPSTFEVGVDQLAFMALEDKGIGRMVSDSDPSVKGEDVEFVFNEDYINQLREEFKSQNSSLSQAEIDTKIQEHMVEVMEIEKTRILNEIQQNSQSQNDEF